MGYVVHQVISRVLVCIYDVIHIALRLMGCVIHYNMTVWILARNDINFSMAAGLIRLHMPGVK